MASSDDGAADASGGRVDPSEPPSAASATPPVGAEPEDEDGTTTAANDDGEPSGGTFGRPELVRDGTGPRSDPASTKDDSHAKSDVAKSACANGGPENVDDDDGPDPPSVASRPADSMLRLTKLQANLNRSTPPRPFVAGGPDPSIVACPADPTLRSEKIAKKLAQSDAALDEVNFEEEGDGEEAAMSKRNTIVLCKSRTSGAWFVRENSKRTTSPRQNSWSGRWVPVAVRRNPTVARSWRKLNKVDLYSLPVSEGAGLEVEYGTDAADWGEDEEESPQQQMYVEATDGGEPLVGRVSIDTTPIIPKAFLVDEDGDDADGEVVAAEPLLPWWKQKKVVSSVICLMIASATIAAVVTVVVGVEDKGVGTSNMAGADADGTPFRMAPPTASPTMCFPIDVAVAMCDAPSTERNWQLSPVEYGSVVVETEPHPFGQGGYVAEGVDSFCLPEGTYQFSAAFGSEDDGYDDIGCTCCEGTYNVTSNGRVLVQGAGVWQYSLAVTTRFSVP
ncbi:hypothetical protein ACHAWF_007041 [Thalassiosira exigua]